jgi:hypothetical protein
LSNGVRERGRGRGGKPRRSKEREREGGEREEREGVERVCGVWERVEVREWWLVREREGGVRERVVCERVVDMCYCYIGEPGLMAHWQFH